MLNKKKIKVVDTVKTVNGILSLVRTTQEGKEYVIELSVFNKFAKGNNRKGVK